MPSIEVEVEHTVDVDFEVWCETCGAGLCDTVNVDDSNIRIPVCASCIEEKEKEMQETIDELNARIEVLEERL